MNTNHKTLIQFPAFSSRSWADLTEEQREVVRAGASEAMAAYTQSVIEQEATLRETMEAEGLVFTDPDVEAFRTNMLGLFQGSELAEGWTEGMFETIADMEIPEICAITMN